MVGGWGGTCLTNEQTVEMRWPSAYFLQRSLCVLGSGSGSDGSNGY